MAADTKFIATAFSVPADASDAIHRIRSRQQTIVVAAVALTASHLFGGGSWIAVAIVGALVFGYALLRPASEVRTDGGAVSSKVFSDPPNERQALIDAIPDPAWVMSRTSIVLNANEAARSIYGGMTSGVAVSAVARNPELIDAIDRALLSGAVQTASLQLRVPVERHLVVVVAPLALPDQRDVAPALLVTVRDLTAQDRLSEMRADFVANASHELRTPLASLRGFVETLQGPARNDPAARDRFLAIMSNQADRMTRLIDDLLTLSRIEMRQHVAPTDQIDLREVVTNVVQGLEPLAASSKVSLDLKVPADSSMVRGDRDELAQVFQNLVQNAIKYGREGGQVRIELRRLTGMAGRPGRVEVAIKDDGPGIDAQHIPRLTERFYRVNTAQSREKGGTGLGLAIVKHIVSRHSGELSIASIVGSGSTFTVTLNDENH